MTPVWWFFATYRWRPAERRWQKTTQGPVRDLTDSEAMRGAFDAAQDPGGRATVVVVYRKVGAGPWELQATYQNERAVVGDARRILKALPLLPLLVLAAACTPAIIGVSAAIGAASVGVTYEVTGEDCSCDAGTCSDAAGTPAQPLP